MKTIADYLERFSRLAPVFKTYRKGEETVSFLGYKDGNFDGAQGSSADVCQLLMTDEYSNLHVRVTVVPGQNDDNGLGALSLYFTDGTQEPSEIHSFASVPQNGTVEADVTIPTGGLLILHAEAISGQVPVKVMSMRVYGVA